MAPIRDPQWHADALARVLEDGIVVLGGDDEVVFASDAAQALLGGPQVFPAAWSWLHARLQGLADDTAGAPQAPAQGNGRVREGRDGLYVRMPEEHGGRDVRARLVRVEADSVQALCLLKDRRSLRELRNDLRLALQARQHAGTLEQVAHDLKAPLHSIALNLDLMRGHLRADEFAEAEERVELLSGEIRRLHRLVQRLLSDAQLPREVVRDFDLRRLVREVVSLLRAQARAHRIALRARLPAGRVGVLGIRDHLKQALVNIMVNGIEAMPQGGRLELDLRVEGEQVLLTICDTGNGIPAALKPMLFQLYVTTKAGGSGLGLYTSRATVREMGGELELGDGPGRGCLVTIRLPLRAEGLAAPGMDGHEPDADEPPDGFAREPEEDREPGSAEDA